MSPSRLWSPPPPRSELCRSRLANACEGRTCIKWRIAEVTSQARWQAPSQYSRLSSPFSHPRSAHTHLAPLVRGHVHKVLAEQLARHARLRLQAVKVAPQRLCRDGGGWEATWEEVWCM